MNEIEYFFDCIECYLESTLNDFQEREKGTKENQRLKKNSQEVTTQYIEEEVTDRKTGFSDGS